MQTEDSRQLVCQTLLLICAFKFVSNSLRIHYE